MSESESSSESFDPMQARINEMKFIQLQKDLREKEELKKKILEDSNKISTKAKVNESKKVCKNRYQAQKQNQDQESASKFEQGQNKIRASNSYAKDECSPKTKSDLNLKFSKEQFNEEKKSITKEEHDRLMKLVDEDFEL